MRVTLITDKPFSAIDRLARLQMQYAPWHEYKLISVHPKRPTAESLQEYEQALEWCDIVDFRYWRSASLLNSMFGTPRKPAILTHYNPYDVNKESWTWAKEVIVVNSEQAALMNTFNRQIPLVIDVNKYEYSPNSRHAFATAIMVANRIEAKKGVLEAAIACKKAGFKFMLVGNISDPSYYERVVDAAGENFEFHHNIPDEELVMLYQKAQVHICNSVDKFETGTLPVLEAMASGCIVVSRKVGHVPDLNNGRNMIVHPGAVDDTDGLADKLKQVITMKPEELNEMAEAAWQTVKKRHAPYSALAYSKIYAKLRSPKALVSIIVPTADRPQSLTKTLVSLAGLNYENFEIVVADDGFNTDETAKIVAGARLGSRLTIKYVAVAEVNAESSEKVYNIAAARNEAAIVAEGKYLMFVDDRFDVDADAINALLEQTGETTWSFGVKDGVVKGFVENFSMVSRETFFKLGGFNERVNTYGGMTQDIATRCKMNQIRLVPVIDAKATPHTKSSSRWSKRYDILNTKVRLYQMYGS